MPPGVQGVSDDLPAHRDGIACLHRGAVKLWFAADRDRCARLCEHQRREKCEHFYSLPTAVERKRVRHSNLPRNLIGLRRAGEERDRSVGIIADIAFLEIARGSAVEVAGTRVELPFL